MIQRNAILLMERLAYDGRTEETERLDEPLRDFIKRKGGINKCVAQFARRLGRRRRKLAAPPKPLATSWRDIFTRDIRGRRSDRTYPNELGRTSR